MVHIDLSHAQMKPGALIRYEIAQDASRAKRLFVAAVISTAMLLVVAGLFVDVMR
ncbi:MAG: hypothetical protein ABIO40_08760 [Devosia sp.]